MKQIVEKARKQFLKMVDNFGTDPYHLLPHVPEVEKWAKYLFLKYPEADKEIILLSVWLHDIGHYPIPSDIDHAIRSERIAKIFLEKENYPKDKMKRVLHCIRAHRCRDIIPETLEAKIVALIDSASHMTTSMYFDMAKDRKENGIYTEVYEKMKRDMKDLAKFPEIELELKELFESWENLLMAYEKINFK